MNRKVTASARLENVLSSLEQLVLKADDDELLRAAGDDKPGISPVSSAVGVRSRDKSIDFFDKGEKKMRRDTDLNSIAWSRVPTASIDRLRFLKTLVAKRPDLPLRTVSVFSGGRKPSSKELDEVIEELVKHGVIGKSKS